MRMKSGRYAFAMPMPTLSMLLVEKMRLAIGLKSVQTLILMSSPTPLSARRAKEISTYF